VTLPSYPPELPRPNRDGYRVARGDGRSIGRQDAGPPTRRRRFSSTVTTLSLSIDLSRSLKARFDRFYDEETAGGTLPFLMPDPATDGTELLTIGGVPLLTAGGVPLLIARTWLCVFGDQLPVETPRGVEWRVSFTLLVLP
jgi:hypothetical protein